MINTGGGLNIWVHKHAFNVAGIFKVVYSNDIESQGVKCPNFGCKKCDSQSLSVIEPK